MRPRLKLTKKQKEELRRLAQAGQQEMVPAMDPARMRLTTPRLEDKLTPPKPVSQTSPK
jgi:hypothetical protein